MKIKVSLKGHEYVPKILAVGDCIDLAIPTDVAIPKVSRTTPVKEFEVNFQIAMQLPKGCYARLYSRSSLWRKYGVMLTNSVGIIDNTYCSDEDLWKAHFVVLKNREEKVIPAGTRLLQFEVVPSQKASFWQKLKWLCSSTLKFVFVSRLNNKTRGGFGSTGSNY